MDHSKLEGEVKPKDKKQHIKVFVRVRPLSGSEKSKNVMEYSGSRELTVRERSLDKNAKKFMFDKVFGPTCQQVEVYRSVVSPLVSEVLAGYNCTVFAYGQTGTGKTFTMEGERSNDPSLSWHEDPLCGIIPRTLSHLFDELRLLQAEYSVKVSFLELYNEELLDLLSPVDDNNKIKLFEDASKKGSVIIHGLEEVTVRNKNEVYGIMERGSLKRQTAATLLNAHSSRSHTVFSITVHIKENSVEGDELIKQGKLNLVDLAGSENIGRSGAVEKRAREAGNINQSLLTLGRVITALVERAPHVPYRESKLTRLLQESLGGRTKTSIIATVSPHLCNMEETLSTLEYAHRAKNIQNKPEVNQKLAKSTLIKEYTEEIDRLRRDLTAAREKNGIYVAQENYDDMLMQIDAQKVEMTELLNSVKNLKECLEEKEKLNTALSLSLDEYNMKYQEAMEKLEKTTCDRDEKAVLLEHHVDTEQKLQQQANSLLAVADQSVSDVGRLHNSVYRRRVLENENVSACHTFRNAAEETLKCLNSDINGLHNNQKQFTSALKQKLDDGCEEIKTWSKDAEQQVSSLIQTQINLQLQLNRELQKLDTVTQIADQSQHSAEEKQALRLQELSEMSEYCLQSIKAIQLKLTSLQDANDGLRQDISSMIDNQNTALDAHIKSTNSTLVHLCDDIRQNVNEWKKNHELDEASVSAIEARKSAFVQKMQQFMEMASSEISSFASQTEEHCASVQKRSSCRKQISEKLHQNLNAIQETTASSSDIMAETHAVSKRVADRLNSFEAQTLAVIGELKYNACDNLEQVVDVLSSDQQQWQEHTQSLKDDCEKMVQNVRDVQKEHHEHGEELLNMLQTSLDVHMDLRQHSVYQMESLRRNCRIGVEKHLNESEVLYGSVNASLQDIHKNLNKLIEEDIHSYVPSGQTPERHEFTYPRTFVSTSPHDRIIERYRLRKLEEVPVCALVNEDTESDHSSASSSGTESSQSLQSPSSSSGSSNVQPPTIDTSPEIVLLEEKENSQKTAPVCNSVTKSKGVKKQRRVLSAQN